MIKETISEPVAYVDRDGRFLGTFINAVPAVPSFRVPEAPQDGRQVWDARREKWSDPPPAAVTVRESEVALEALRLSGISEADIEKARENVKRRAAT